MSLFDWPSAAMRATTCSRSVSPAGASSIAGVRTRPQTVVSFAIRPAAAVPTAP